MIREAWGRPHVSKLVEAHCPVHNIALLQPEYPLEVLGACVHMRALLCVYVRVYGCTHRSIGIREMYSFHVMVLW